MRAAPFPPSFRIAALATQYKRENHADVIVSRWLQPHPKDEESGWFPRTEIASLFVLQTPEGDVSGEISARHGVPRFATVREALTLGGSELAVDGILLIGEHGEFPHNAYGQKLYPRKELFDQVVEVFEKSGRVVPVFFDKHLSWSPAAVHEMYWRIKEMGIPFFGGSSISLTPLSRPLTLEGLPAPREVMALYWNCVEPYLFHSLELAQTVLEGRSGGETGAVSVIGWKGQGVWDALENKEISGDLLEAAAASVSPEAVEHMRQLQAGREEEVYANQLVYPDGMKVTHFMQKTAVRKWCLAFPVPETGETHAAYAEAGGREGFFSHFARLNREIQEFFLSGNAPVPLERLYFTSMATAACMQALSRPKERMVAPILRMPPPRNFPG